MATMIVATYRPAFPERGVKVSVHKASDWPDCAPPGLTTAWRVDNVTNREQAIAVALERAAGKPTTAQRFIPA